MGAWGKTWEEKSTYVKDDGTYVVIKKTMLAHHAGPPFGTTENDPVDQQVLINLEVSGSASDAVKEAIVQWIRNGYHRPSPELLRDFKKVDDDA